MHPELAPPPRPLVRRGRRLDAVAARERQIARLQAEQRLEVAALFREDLGGSSERFVADELALAWARSPRQARGRLLDALAFASCPAVVALVADGTWLLDHADAVLGELAGSGLPDCAQEQVLELVLSREVRHTPYELRLAVRTAIVVLFPEHAVERAAKAAADRDVTTSSDGPGAACLSAFGPATDVAAMMASLDALTWPPAADDPRTAAQRRFDTLRDLVCGRAQPAQWQVHVLVDLATLQGADELPAEVVGSGPVPAALARQAAAAGELRRVVVDEHGRLVAVDPVVHRPDLAASRPLQPFPVAVDVEPTVESEPDQDAPSAEDLAWLEEHTDRRAVYAREDRARAARGRPRRTPLHAFEGVSPVELHAFGLARHEDDSPTSAAQPGCWSAAALDRALRRIGTEPLRPVDLSTRRYAVSAPSSAIWSCGTGPASSRAARGRLCSATRTTSRRGRSVPPPRPTSRTSASTTTGPSTAGSASSGSRTGPSAGPPRAATPTTGRPDPCSTTSRTGHHPRTPPTEVGRRGPAEGPACARACTGTTQGRPDTQQLTRRRHDPTTMMSARRGGVPPDTEGGRGAHVAARDRRC